MTKEIKEIPSFDDSLQLDLFSSLVSNEPQTSNSIYSWEAIPKYFNSPQKQKLLRDKSGLASPVSHEFEHNNTNYILRIQPALIKEGSDYKAYFPSASEEAIEEVLKKFLTKKGKSMHSKKESETWVRYTLRDIFNELKNRNKLKSIVQIKHSLEIMAGTVYTLIDKDSGDQLWQGSILQEVFSVSRKKYLENSELEHAAKLSAFISNSINTLDVRPYNYSLFFKCKNQLSSWIFKLLVNKFTQASNSNTYHFKYSRLKSSGLLDKNIESKNRLASYDALNDLVNLNIIKTWEKEEKKQGRAIIDVVFTIYAHDDFIKSQVNANKKLKDISKPITSDLNKNPEIEAEIVSKLPVNIWEPSQRMINFLKQASNKVTHEFINQKIGEYKLYHEAKNQYDHFSQAEWDLRFYKYALNALKLDFDESTIDRLKDTSWAN